MEEKIEKLRLWHQDGREHFVDVAFASNMFAAAIGACYGGNSSGIEMGKQIAFWRTSYEPPILGCDEGHAQLGDGRIDIEVEVLRGIGFGSLLMQPLVMWIKSRAAAVPVVPINLAADDARTAREKDIRNRFYEKLGFNFVYRDDDHTWGESLPMLSSALIVPALQLSRGWKVDSVEGDGEIFS